MFDGFFNAIFGNLITYNPLYGLLAVSFVITLIITLVYKFMTDQKELKRVRDETKDIRDQMKLHKDNPQKMSELQKRSLEISMGSFKHQIKPMIVTMIPILIIFGWLKATYIDINNLNFLGFIDTWIWTYIVSAMIFSIILRKLFKVY